LAKPGKIYLKEMALAESAFVPVCIQWRVGELVGVFEGDFRSGKIDWVSKEF
jgi:hypothetical protein